MNNFHKTRFLLSAMAAALALLGVSAYAEDVAHKTDPFGRRMPELTAEWWQLVASLPAANHPLLDTSGAFCAVGQRGPIWFLFGTFVGNATRACTLPENKALFFPVINSIDLNVTNQTVKDLRGELAPCFDAVTELSVEVDGKPLKRLLRRNRVQSVPFEVTLPPDNLFGLAPGIYSPAVDDGFYVMLEPLETGTHTVHFSGAVPAGIQGCITGGFGVDVTYTLNVVPIQLK